MLTAAPSTLANYANKHNKVLLHHTDIVNCFATDHLEAIKDNKIDQIYNPVYALSHILLSGKINKMYEIGSQKFADIRTGLNHVINTREVGSDSSGVRDLVGYDSYETGSDFSKSKDLLFRKVLIPKDLKVQKGELVWHHFGIVIDRYDYYNEDKILSNQFGSPYFRLMSSKISRSEIDFSDRKIFHRDILGKIIAEQKNLKNKKRIVSDPSISKIELPKDSKIKFIH